MLSEALRVQTTDVKSRLVTLMEAPPPDVESRVERYSRRILLPAIGVIVGATSLGMLFMVSGQAEFDPNAQAPALRPVSVDEPITTIGSTDLIPPRVVVRGE